MDVSIRPRILLADDHTVVAEGVRAMLAKDFTVVAVARNRLELMKLAHELNPDAIIVDIAMPVLNGLDAAVRLAAEMPKCPVIVMSGYDGAAYIRAALRAGAKGYIVKTRAEELPQAIRTVLRGKCYLPDSLPHGTQIQSESASSSPLSPREQEILQLIADGKTGKEIAAIAGVSLRTVEFHKYNIMNKLNLRTSADLIRYAIQTGLVSAY